MQTEKCVSFTILNLKQGSLVSSNTTVFAINGSIIKINKTCLNQFLKFSLP